MPDLLTHVLVAYVLGTALAARYDWITPQYVTAAMVGAVVPDIMNLVGVVPGSVMAALHGAPLVLVAFHTLPGSVVGILVGSLLVAPEHRTRVLLLTLLGMSTHHALDLMLITSSGASYHVFWPLTYYEPAVPQLYRSSDRWLALLSGTLAAVAWYLVRRRPVEQRPADTSG